jgi:hypothetical protein
MYYTANFLFVLHDGDNIFCNWSKELSEIINISFNYCTSCYHLLYLLEKFCLVQIIVHCFRTISGNFNTNTLLISRPSNLVRVANRRSIYIYILFQITTTTAPVSLLLMILYTWCFIPDYGMGRRFEIIKTEDWSRQNISASCEEIFRFYNNALSISIVLWRVYPLLGNDSLSTFLRSLRMPQKDVYC